MEICKELFDQGFPYLELTELGKRELDGIEEKHPENDVFKNLYKIRKLQMSPQFTE
ncbi:MAG: hypothetical protein Q8T04_00385 [Bacteroidota bacterium]|jgi:hypothetical protein|nr:hypothetical protein [Bacteroidota bacterium]